MQNHVKIQRLILVIILTIIVLGSLIAAQNFTYAQELHQKTLYEMTKYTPKENAYISVGQDPGSIGVDYFTNTIYVENNAGNTVSVIDGTSNTKIKDIPVGKNPCAIGVNDMTNTIYVVNRGDNTVSVIDGESNTKIKDIPVGKIPLAIGVNTVSNIIYATNGKDKTISVINGTNNTKIKDIPVGNVPGAIGVNDKTDTIYVANSDNNTVSVINGTSITKITDIPVGKSAVGNSPQTVGVNDMTNTIYVANSDDNTVSVIDGTNNTKIKDIPVGNSPQGIGVNSRANTIYVANSDDNTVSVINGTNNTKIKDIPVGNVPWGIGVISYANTIYVANSDDNTVSVVDGKVNKVVAKVMFKIAPFNAGHIECDKEKLIAPVAEEFYMWPGSICTAKPNQGFEFAGWQENLGGNSSRLITFLPPPSILGVILDFLHMNTDTPESKLNITKFGNFTANFKALPPPIPPEYVATLFTVVATAFIGSWLTPTVIAWRNARKQGSKLDHYHNEIKKLYNDGKIEENDIIELNKLRGNITHEYTRGNINNEYYPNLKNEISIVYEEIFKKRIDSLKNLPEKDKGKLLVEIKDDIDDAYSKQKISEFHYTLLEKRLSNYGKPNS